MNKVGLDGARKLFAEVGPQMAKYCNKYTTAIYGLENAKYGKLLGTGSFIVVGSATYFVSSLHVFESDLPGIAYALTDGDPPVEIEGECFALKHPYDIIAVRVDLYIQLHSGQVRSKGALPVRYLDSLVEISADIYFIQGYADRDSRYSALYGGIISKSMQLTTTLGIASEFNWYDPKIHFTLDYQMENEDEYGRLVQAPFPTGLSGSLVWKTNRMNCDDAWNPDEARVVGVAVTWDKDKKVIVCTKIKHLCSRIAEASE